MAKMLPMLDPFEEIRRLYFSTTRETIEQDLQRALELLKQMPSEEDRERAAGLMHGLTDLMREWKAKRRRRKPASGKAGRLDGPGTGTNRPGPPGRRKR